ncbi:MAG TPA: helix-turn-helix domain-containing protein [Gemmataceae bacterium]|nr:helix-turn-helix domain-containing protein [Gemmataceae bacterium]
MVQYYTLEQAAQILRISAEQLKEMARKKEIRAFQDRSGWRFRSQEIDEMARERGFGSDPELPLGEAVKGKASDSGGKDVFNFSLDLDDSDEVPLGKGPASSEKSSRSGSGSRKSGSSKSPPPKASSDSDVRLVLDAGDLDFGLDTEGSKPPASKAPVSPPPKVGSSKSRVVPPLKDDSGVRIVPLDQPSDSDVKITPSSPHDSDVPVGRQGAKTPSDSDIRIEEMPGSGSSGEIVTEEIDLDAEQRKADAARSRHTRHKPKPGSSPILPTTSPFELSEHDIDMDGPTIPPSTRDSSKPAGKKPDDTDSSSDFELKPMTDSSSPLEPSSDEMPVLEDDEVGLGELTGGKGASGINLQDPADSGISLEQEGSDEMEFELSLGSGSTPKPAPADEEETDSSSDFELSLQDEDASPSEGSSSEFELSLQEEDASPTEGSSSEFELSLDAEGGELAVDEGSSDLALEAPGSDSDSEFELTLDEGGGLSVEEEGAAEEDENVFETDFEVPALDEESGSEAVALDEADTDLESSEFDLALEGEESGSQVVPLEDEEEADEGAATVQRKGIGAVEEDEEGLEDIGEALDDDLDEAPDLEDEEEVAAAPVSAAAAPPAEWGVMPALVLLPCTILLFVVGLMSFELIQGMWGYHTGNKVSNMVIHPIAKMFDDSLPDN